MHLVPCRFALYKIQQPIPSHGLHPPHPHLHMQQLNQPLLKILSIFLKNVLIFPYIHKIECILASGGWAPQTPYFRDTILGLALPPANPDLPTYLNPRSASDMPITHFV